MTAQPVAVDRWDLPKPPFTVAGEEERMISRRLLGLPPMAGREIVVPRPR